MWPLLHVAGSFSISLPSFTKSVQHNVFKMFQLPELWTKWASFLWSVHCLKHLYYSNRTWSSTLTIYDVLFSFLFILISLVSFLIYLLGFSLVVFYVSEIPTFNAVYHFAYDFSSGNIILKKLVVSVCGIFAVFSVQQDFVWTYCIFIWKIHTYRYHFNYLMCLTQLPWVRLQCCATMTTVCSQHCFVIPNRNSRVTKQESLVTLILLFSFSESCM